MTRRRRKARKAKPPFASASEVRHRQVLIQFGVLRTHAEDLEAKLTALQKSVDSTNRRVNDFLGPEAATEEDRTAAGQWARARRLRLEQQVLAPPSLLWKLRKWLRGKT